MHVVSTSAPWEQDWRSQAEYVNVTGGEDDEQPSRVGSDVLWCWLQLPATSISPNLAPCDDTSPHSPPCLIFLPICLPSASPSSVLFPWAEEKAWSSYCWCDPPATTAITTTLVSHNSSFSTFFSRSIRPSLSLSLFIYWEEDAIWGGDGAKVADCNIPLFLSALVNHFIHFSPLYSHCLCLSHVDFVRGGRDKRISFHWFNRDIHWNLPPLASIRIY